MTKLRYQAILAVIIEGETVTEVAAHFGGPGKRFMRGSPVTRKAVWTRTGIVRTNPTRCREKVRQHG